MRLVEPLVDRPLPVFLGGVVLLLLGGWCLLHLPVKRNPDVVIPYSVVLVPYEGASPEDVESEVTLELEEQLNTLDGLRHLRSKSAEGYSIHVLEFEDRVDMGEALQRVRDKTELAQVALPPEAGEPVVREISFDEVPILLFTISGGRDSFALHEIAEALKPELESVAGVSRVEVFGGHERQVQIRIDPPLLAAHGLTLEEVAATLSREGRAIPAGVLRAPNRDWLIRSTGEFVHLDEVRQTVLATRAGHPITVRDVAEVSVHHRRMTTGSRFNGQPSVTLIVRPGADANTLETAHRLKAVVARHASELPPGVQIAVTADSVDVIRSMIHQLGTSGLIGMLLVAGVLFAVFGARHALLVSMVLPFSLLFAVIGLFVFDMEISDVALFALILVLGLVVDGAIIVGEAIYQRREQGLCPTDAAKGGVAAVGVPVLSADLTTVGAFLPMLLMVGIMGQYMSVIPKVVVFAMIGSIFADHVFLPAMASRLRARPRPPLAPDRSPWFSSEFQGARRLYGRILERALRHRAAVLSTPIAACAIAVALLAGGVVESIFLPAVDRGRFSIDYALPVGTNLAETDRVGAWIEAQVAAMPEVSTFVLTTGDTGALNADVREGGRVGPQFGRLTVELVPRAERLRSQSEIVAELRRSMASLAGVEVDVEEMSEGPPVGAALAIRLRGPDVEELEHVAAQVERRIKEIPGAVDVRLDHARDRPQVHVRLARQRASAQYGIDPAQVSRTLLAAFHGVEVGQMWVDDERLSVELRATERFAETPENVRELQVRGRTGQIVPIGEIADVELRFAHDAIRRDDAKRAVTLRAVAAEGTSSIALEVAARAALADLDLPSRVGLDFGGESEERDRSYSSLWSALGWGLLIIFVVLAVQLDSLVQPWIVLLTIPLSLIGVVTGLGVTGTPFSFMVFIGMVSLTGIVVNDGIVLMDAINKGRLRGMPCEVAIREGAIGRLRPVFLTTVTTVFGLLPLTVSLADGAEFWRPLGIAIVSGLLVASVLTLVFVPVAYSVLESATRALPRSLAPHLRQPTH